MHGETAEADGESPALAGSALNLWDDATSGSAPRRSYMAASSIAR